MIAFSLYLNYNHASFIWIHISEVPEIEQVASTRVASWKIVICVAYSLWSNHGRA